jgi:uncharacterized protein (TIGR02391 family)
MPLPSSSGRPARGRGFLARTPFPKETVRVIRNEGTDDEEILEVVGHIQPDSGFFDVDAPIFEGDIVEVADPRMGSEGRERRLAQRVKVNSNAPESVQHTQVIWGRAPAARVAPVRRLTFENLHPQVQAAAGDLYADGHFESAVSEAFKSIEVRVRAVTGLDKSGAPLMQEAFRPADPHLDGAVHEGRSGEDEREGFMHIFRGAMIGIRNPGAHELFKPGDPQQALEYLGFASLLHRRIDAAEAKKGNATGTT